MRLSFIFELLLIFILIAFAASRVIDSTNLRVRKTRSTGLHKHNRHHSKVANKNRQQETASKYCSCTTKLCNCCREFNIPVVSLQGPGCASLQYLRGDRLAISMSFGERVLTNTTIDGKKPKPVCMPLPGGVSKFCGRVYNIGRQGEDFNACLGLELRAVQDVEAALRVSCFRFGPKGLKVEPSQPLPAVESSSNEDDDEDDDDDDDDEDEFDFDDVDDDDDGEDDDDDEDNSVDYGTFSVFDDDFIDSFFVPSDSSSGNKKKKATTTTTVKPTLRTATRKVMPALKKRPVSNPVSSTLPTKDITKTPAVVVTTPTTVTTVAPTERMPTKRFSTRRKPRPTKRVTTTTGATSPQTVAIYEKDTQSMEPVTTSELPKTTNVPVFEPIALVTSATIVTSDKKPFAGEEIASNSIDGQFVELKNASSNQIVVASHESIAAVSAMLQNVPGEVKVHANPQAASTVVTTTLDNTTPKEMTDVTIRSDYSTEKQETESTATAQNEASSTDAMADAGGAVTATDSTTLVDATTETDEKHVNDEEDTENDDVTVQSFILKNDEEDDAGGMSADESVSTTSAVTEEATTELLIDNRTKVESKDVLTDIIDGVVETFDDDDDSEETKNPVNDGDKDDDDDDDDDDILGDDDVEEEEEEEDDDDEDEDFVARKAKQHQKHLNGRRMRQSRDMWLDRLHW